jgi:hypothetical protein
MSDQPVGRIEQLSHTKGPWRWMSDQALVGDHGRRPVVLTGGADGSLLTRGEDGRLRDLAADEANARLIAAAPDLLEALRVTAGNIRSLGPAGALDAVPEPYRLWLAVVESAIAKAEGR